jgi:hypothetical protein
MCSEADFQVLSWHSPGGTEENHKKPKSEQLVSRPQFELTTCQILSKGANHSPIYGTISTEVFQINASDRK